MITEWGVATTSTDRVCQVHVMRVDPIRKCAICIFHVVILVKCAQILTLIVGKGITRILNEIIETRQRLLAHFRN